MRHFKWVISGLALLTFAWASIAMAGGNKLKKQDVPEAVHKSVVRSYPFAKVTGYEKKERDGTIYYEVFCSVGKMKLEMVFTEEGELYEVEEVIVLKKVPKPVVKAIKKAHPKKKITKIQKLTRGEEVLYEFYLAKGKEKLEVEADVDGNIVYPKPEEPAEEQKDEEPSDETNASPAQPTDPESDSEEK